MPTQPQIVGVVGNTGKSLNPTLALPASQPGDVNVVHLLTSGVPVFTPPAGWGAVAGNPTQGLNISSANSYCYALTGAPGAFVGSLSGVTAREWAIVGVTVRGATIEQARLDLKSSPSAQILYGAQTPAVDNDLRVLIGVWRDITNPPPGARNAWPAGWAQNIDVNTNNLADAPNNYAAYVDSIQLGAGTAGVPLPNVFGNISANVLQATMEVVFQPVPTAADGDWLRRGGGHGTRGQWRNWRSEYAT